MPTGSVTIVISPRERFSYARQSLDSIYRNTDYPFGLVYVDGNSPSDVSEHLRREAIRRGFRLIRTDHFLTPNQARNLGSMDLDSTYVVFLDNDVDVSPGWLTHLVTCAEETGAWAVSPVYFEGAPKDRVIHMAGGDADFVVRDGVRLFEEEHVRNGERFDAVAPTLRRGPTGFFEFHCALVRLDVLRKLGPLDEEYTSLHEHMDLSLRIRQAGGAIYLEPKAQITYVFGLLTATDVEYSRLRWSEEWNRQSTNHFAKKWNLVPTDPWVPHAIEWGTNHRAHMERMRRGPWSVLKRSAQRVLPDRLYSTLRELRG